MRRQQKIKLILTVMTILTILLVTTDIYARAGGGGGSGKGGGGIIALIIWGIYTAIITIILFIKTSKSDYILRWAFKQDKIWDSNKMKALSKSMFFKMQQAWMNRNIDTVKEFITDGLYVDYKQQLDIMLTNQEKNILES
ncbi:MAG TPA: hypothetical protein VGW31_15235, partial [Hanamia sp.]|nr:hypothetical protein [Hanamia sp.]